MLWIWYPTETREVVMSPSTRVREVYAEIRRSCPADLSPGEALASAMALVELFSVAEDNGPVFDTRTGGLPFSHWAVDTAIADGGWRVLCREWAGMGWESSDGCGGARPAEWLV